MTDTVLVEYLLPVGILRVTGAAIREQDHGAGARSVTECGPCSQTLLTPTTVSTNRVAKRRRQVGRVVRLRTELLIAEPTSVTGSSPMYDVPFARACHSNGQQALAWLVVMALFSITQARADNVLGFYVGGAVGHARFDASAPYVSGFRENHSAFKVMVGLRPISLVGTELAYLDFGHPSHLNGIISTDVTMKGAAAFGMIYLPVPVVDIYAKGGLARLQSTVSTTIVCPPMTPCIAIATPGPVSRTNLGFAGGVGAQVKVGSFGVRGEYERFNAAGGNPGLFSVGLTWTF